MAKTLGIDIGGTNLRIGVFDYLKLIDEIRVQADFSHICKTNIPEVALETLLTVTANGVQQVLNQYPEIRHIGIGFPGFIHPKTKIIAQSPNLPGLLNVNLTQALSQRLNKTVIVENDASAAAFGEYVLANKPDGGLLYLGLGTGVGGGLVLNGMPFAGQHGCAMEAGHIIVEPGGRLCGCGNLGCMEQYASASGVKLSYFELTQQKLTSANIAQLAKSGDQQAMQAFQLAANALAQALASMLKVVDVSHVVIGGGMVGAWDLMQDTFNTRLQQDLIPVLRNKIVIHQSAADDIAGMLGAALLALNSQTV